jgi:hypothetical protein
MSDDFSALMADLGLADEPQEITINCTSYEFISKFRQGVGTEELLECSGLKDEDEIEAYLKTQGICYKCRIGK